MIASREAPVRHPDYFQPLGFTMVEMHAKLFGPNWSAPASEVTRFLIGNEFHNAPPETEFVKHIPGRAAELQWTAASLAHDNRPHESAGTKDPMRPVVAFLHAEAVKSAQKDQQTPDETNAETRVHALPITAYLLFARQGLQTEGTFAGIQTSIVDSFQKKAQQSLERLTTEPTGQVPEAAAALSGILTASAVSYPAERAYAEFLDTKTHPDERASIVGSFVWEKLEKRAFKTLVDSLVAMEHLSQRDAQIRAFAVAAVFRIFEEARKIAEERSVPASVIAQNAAAHGENIFNAVIMELSSNS